MRYTKVEEQKDEFWLVYFIDSQQRKQGELLCYKTEGKFPSEENLLYVEAYKDNLLLDKQWMKRPEFVAV